MELVEQFLLWARDAGQSPQTIMLRRKVLGHFVQHVDPLSATPEDITAWLRRYQNHSPNTRRAYRNAVAAMYRWAHEWAELIDRNPMVKVPKMFVAPGVARPISRADLNRAILAADERTALWLMLGGDGGLRRAEIARVHARHVMGRHLLVEGKGSRQRTVPMTERLERAIVAWEPTMSGRMWEVTPGRVGDVVTSHLRHRCGIDATTHQLRHSAATEWFRVCGDIRMVQTLLGHASSRSTEVYVPLGTGFDRIVDRMDGVA